MSVGTPVTLSAPELLFILKEEAFRCTQLGVQLKVAYGTLRTMEQQSLTSRPIKDCFMEMCQHWLTNATDNTWDAVYTALVRQDNKRLMTHLRDTRKYSPTSTVDLPFSEFIQELDEMAASWYLFGSALKIPVKVLNEIQNKGGMRSFMMAMLGEWLNTGNATWEQLQQALISVGNKKLATDIEKYKKEDTMKQQQQPPPQVSVLSVKQERGDIPSSPDHSSDPLQQTLTSDDLLDVLEQLTSLTQGKFWKLGLKLGLIASTLNKLKDSCSSDEFGQHVMQAWLNQEDKVTNTSWRSLVDALESKLVMERVVAQQIRDWLASR